MKSSAELSRPTHVSTRSRLGMPTATGVQSRVVFSCGGVGFARLKGVFFLLFNPLFCSELHWAVYVGGEMSLGKDVAFCD